MWLLNPATKSCYYCEDSIGVNSRERVVSSKSKENGCCGLWKRGWFSMPQKAYYLILSSLPGLRILAWSSLPWQNCSHAYSSPLPFCWCASYTSTTSMTGSWNSQTSSPSPARKTTPSTGEQMKEATSPISGMSALLPCFRGKPNPAL